jgi:hypothetical protein
MYERDDFNKKDHMLKILKGFPESFKADLLDKLSDIGFKRGEDSPGDFLEEKLDDSEFADNFMKLFDDYAKEECFKDLLQDKPKYLKKLLELPGADADVDTNYAKRVIQEKLNQGDGGQAFIRSLENLDENGKMHIFFFKIAGAEQFDDLEPKIERLEILKSNLEKLKKLQSKIAKLEVQISKIEKLKGQKSKNAKSKSLQSKIKKLEDLKSQIRNLKDMQSKINKNKDLKSHIKSLKDLQSLIKKLEDLSSQIKNSKDTESNVDKLEDLNSQINNLKYLQSNIEKFEVLGSQIKNFKDMQSEINKYGNLQLNIDALLQGKLNDFLWWAAQPVLVSVESRKYNGRSEVWFKWVESRLWNEWKTDRPTPYFVRRMERSVSYFIIDLENKRAQLRIQLIRPNALKSLKEEYNQFRAEIDKLLGFFHFSRLPMEAVVKKFLSLNRIEPLTWEMKLPHGAYFSAKGKPDLFFSIFSKIPILRQLGIGVINKKIFFGRKLSCEYQLAKDDWGSLKVRIKVDGEKDVLTVLIECEHLQMETIIDTILRIDKNRVIDNNLKRFLKNLTSVERFLFERIVLSFDYHFSRLEYSEIKEKHLEDTEWLPKKIVKNARDRLWQQYPDNFISIVKMGNRVLVKK